MPRIVTHVRPHLDDICAAWLVRRFWRGFGDAPVSFINNADRPVDVDASPDKIYVGVGRGRFDEHRGVLDACAASLVWDELHPTAEADDLTKRAVGRLVAWVLAEDTGRLKTGAEREFSVPSLIDGRFFASGESSESATAFGLEILDALLENLRGRLRLEDDWAGRREFQSHFGRAVALVTDEREVDSYAYAQGFDLVLIVDHAGTYRTFRARADAPIDLTPVAEALAERDPDAKWFFHHSKHLLILGGDHGGGPKPSRLSLDEMIELVK
jgi:hypothetical protein